MYQFLARRLLGEMLWDALHSWGNRLLLEQHLPWESSENIVFLLLARNLHASYSISVLEISVYTCCSGRQFFWCWRIMYVIPQHRRHASSPDLTYHKGSYAPQNLGCFWAAPHQTPKGTASSGDANPKHMDYVTPREDLHQGSRWYWWGCGERENPAHCQWGINQ